MRLLWAHIRNLAVAIAIALIPAMLCSAADTTGSTATTHKSAVKHPAHHATRTSQSVHKKSRKKYVSRKRGQQKIDAERARQIQEALIREHYLTGKASGNWDAATQQAMQKYQADHGWQSKTTPDSRALIKLGLGPDQRNLLNPESAMTSSPQTVHAVSDPAKATDPDPAQPQNQQQK